MTLLTLAWRQAWLRPGRTFLTLAGVTIGVAAVVAMVVLEANARGQFDQVRQTLSGKGGLEIVARSGGRFDATEAEPARRVEGVRELVPSLRQITTIYAGEKKVRVLLVGLEPGRESLVRDLEVASGRMAQNNGEIVVEAQLAESLGIKAGDVVRLLTRRLFVRRTVVGLFRSKSAAGAETGSTVLVPLEDLRDLFEARGRADVVHATLAPGLDEAAQTAVEERVRAALSETLTVRAAGAYQTAGEKNFVLMNQALRATRVLLVIIALFIALNTFLINVGERQPTFATLRAIGATSGQIAAMLVVEALVVGLVGSVLGVALGVYGARPLLREFQGSLGVSPERVEISNGAIVGGLLLGPLTSLAAVILPALRASRVSPLEGMRPPAVAEGGRFSPWFPILGLVATALGFLGMYLAAAGVLHDRFFAASGGLVVLGSAGFLHVFTPAFTAAVAAATRPFFGAEVELARRQVLRHPTRTWLTATTLFVALAATLGIGNALFNVTDGVRGWVRRSLPTDFIVRTMAPRLEDAATADLPAATRDELERLPGVAWIDPASFVRCAAGPSQAMLMIRDYRPYDELPIDLKEGEPADVRARLLAGEAVVNASLLHELKAKVGDEVRLETEAGARTTRIAGVMMEFAFPGNVVCIDRGPTPSLARPDSVDAFLIMAEPGRAPELEGVLRRYCDERGLLLQTQASLRENVDRAMDNLTAGLWMLLVLAFVVASFGVFNAMAINVIEQTRELGLMRAIGMEPAQVRRMFLLQGVMIAAIGLLPALVVGSFLGYAINRAFSLLAGFAVTYGFHPGLAFGGIVFGAVIVALTAYALGARAARLEIRDALART